MATKTNSFYMQGGLPAATDLDTTFHLTGPLQLGFPAGAAAAPTITVAHGSYTMTAIPGAAVAAYRAHTGLVMVTEGTAKGMLIRDTLLVMRDLNFISSRAHHNSQLQGPPLDAYSSYDPQSVADKHDPCWLYFNAGLGPSAGYDDDKISPHLRASAMRNWELTAPYLPQVAQCSRACPHHAAASGTHAAMPAHSCRKWHT